MLRKFLSGRMRVGAAVTVAAALVLTGCGDSDTPTANNPDATTLIAYTGQSGGYQINFNPYSPSQIGGIGSIFEPLFFITQVNDKAVPRLGTEYKWNDTGTVLSITTREGVKWSDGKPFTAKDVAFTLNLIKKTKTINTFGFNGEVAVVDDTHLTVTWPAPAYVDGPFVLGRTFIVPEHLWASVDAANSVMEKPVGTGPYTLGSFKPEAYELTANTSYWGGAPKVKKVRFVSLSGNQAGANALKAGTIDWQTGPVPDIQNVAKNYPGYEAITVPMNQMALMTCSNAAMGCKGPQTDVAVRKAIYYAMDRTQYNKLAFQDTASEMSPGFALPERDKAMVSTKLTDQVAPMTAQAAKATALLEGAGYAKGADGVYAKGGKPLTLTVNVVTGWTDYITAVNTIAEQLKPVGIKLTVVQTSWNEWTEVRGKGNYQLLIDSLHQGPAPDPYYLYNWFFGSANTARVGQVANPNYARYTNPAVDAALTALRKLDPKDATARQAQLDIIQTNIERDTPYIPMLTGGTTSEFNTKKFSGWPTKENMYAFPAVWGSPDNSQVFLTLTPKG
ncbi:MAG TPA: ABC transporter substrate-binding protein [Pilimelia sp.]|nr:ABC transporter substrate-binding protein [Pilimelia sp.]